MVDVASSTGGLHVNSTSSLRYETTALMGSAHTSHSSYPDSEANAVTTTLQLSSVMAMPYTNANATTRSP